MTIATSGPFDDTNAYSQSFTATNMSFIPLRNFNIAIGFCDIQTARNDFVFINNCKNDQNLPHMLVGDLSWNATSLARDEPFTITLTDELTTPTEKYRAQHPHVVAGWKTVSALKGANAVVIATFQPWIVPCWSWISEWVCVKRSRFLAEEQPNGKVMWRPVPLTWKPGKIGRLVVSIQMNGPAPNRLHALKEERRGESPGRDFVANVLLVIRNPNPLKSLS
jgi:hypothetical protein